MTNATAEAKQYWGYLITPDKSPSPKFEQLLLGIAHYISKHVVPWDVGSLIPQKLAAFYRLVGGNHDALFLESPNPALGFIYKSLGCYHTLQQDKDPFVTPEIPALTLAGFVRWQTVQLLLNPEEHVPYIQEAVKRFEILNPGPGGSFPKILPAECLPKVPDTEMCMWHERVGDRLRIESEAQTPQSAPPTARTQTSRPADLDSVTDSTVDDRSIVDANEYFRKGSSSTTNARRPSYPKFMPTISPQEPRPIPPPNPRDRRRGSSINLSKSVPNFEYADGPTPTATNPNAAFNLHPYARRTSPRAPRHARHASVESVSSTSSDELSPRRNSRHNYSHIYSQSNNNNNNNNNNNTARVRIISPKDRSPRSFSAARSPDYYPEDDPLSALKDPLGRRHSSHILANFDRRDSGAQQPPSAAPPPPQGQGQGQNGSRASQTLSPQFFAATQQGNGSGRTSNQASPTGPTMPPPQQQQQQGGGPGMGMGFVGSPPGAMGMGRGMNANGGMQSASVPLPQGQFARGSWRSVPGFGPVESWRGKLGGYAGNVNGNENGSSGVGDMGAGRGERGDRGRRNGREREQGPIEGVRFVEGVGGMDERGFDRDWEGEERRRRRRDFEREWESEREERRRERREERRERRRSGGE